MARPSTKGRSGCRAHDRSLEVGLVTEHQRIEPNPPAATKPPGPATASRNRIRDWVRRWSVSRGEARPHEGGAMPRLPCAHLYEVQAGRHREGENVDRRLLPGRQEPV